MTTFGGKFKIIDKRHFALPGTYGRFWHIASIAYGVREYMFFGEPRTGQTWIEEVTGGTLSQIEDESLWQELANFVDESGIKWIQSTKR